MVERASYWRRALRHSSWKAKSEIGAGLIDRQENLDKATSYKGIMAERESAILSLGNAW